MALRISIVDPNLVWDKLLKEWIVFMLLPAHFDFFDIIEYPLQLIETNIAGVVSTMKAQVLLDFVILVKSKPWILSIPIDSLLINTLGC